MGLQYAYAYVIAIDIPSPANGVAVGRQKIAENTSPMPRDRVFVNYSYFDNTSIFNGVDVNRVTPGFEKTFWDGLASFEMRFPFASTLDSDIFSGAATSTSEIEFGNLTMYLKALLWGGEAGDVFAISAGLGFALPTADDVRVFNAMGTELIAVDNEALHLLPFLGALYAPNDQFFAQGFLQFDFDANGNPVSVFNTTTNALAHAGRANDVTFLYVDVGVGYWVYRTNDPRAIVTGVAPTAELHYNRSLQDTDFVQSGVFRVGDLRTNIEVINAVVGATIQCGDNLTVTTGYTVPVGGGADQQFDGEFRLLANWLFGRANRFTRTGGR